MVGIKALAVRALLDIPVFLSLTGPMMLLASYLMVGLQPAKIPLIVSALVPFSIYLFNRISDVEEDMISRPSRAKFFKMNKKTFKMVSILLQLTAVILAFSRSLYLGSIALLPVTVSTLYSAGESRLKQYFLVKNLVIGFLWAIFIALLPFSGAQQLDLGLVFVFIFILLKVGTDSILADIKDIEADASEGIKTVPQRIGVDGTRKFLYFVNSLAYSAVAAGLVLDILTPESVFILLVYPYSLITTYLVGRTNPRLNADLYADAEFYLMGLVSLLLLV